MSASEVFLLEFFLLVGGVILAVALIVAVFRIARATEKTARILKEMQTGSDAKPKP